MLTHDEVSGAVIFAGRTDRGAVVLVAEFFRSGIVFVTRSYENIVRSIRRLSVVTPIGLLPVSAPAIMIYLLVGR